MHLLSRFILVQTRREAWRLVLAYTAVACLLSGIFSAVVAALRGQDVFAEFISGAGIALLIAPTLTSPVARAALLVHARERALEAMARTDAATGALNRRGFFADGEAMFARAEADEPVCAVLVDLDEFKTINDTHGHAAGDAALVALARAMQDVVAGWGGIVGRLGGDELCALAPDMPERRALLLAARLRGVLGTLLIAVEGGEIIRASASVGVVTQSADDATLDALLARADAALYAQKADRRSRRVVTRAALRAAATG